MEGKWSKMEGGLHRTGGTQWTDLDMDQCQERNGGMSLDHRMGEIHQGQR